MRFGMGVMALTMLVGSVVEARAAEEPSKRFSAVAPAEKPAPVMTFEAACCYLRSLPPGEHHITLLHPYTCCPVDVCFCLPCGDYCLECGKGLCKEKIRFKYPGLCNDVVIRFHKKGDVSVKN